MARELKFRVWDGKSLHDVGELHWMAKDIGWYGPGFGQGLVAQDGHTLMQFTGLKDSEGREIYEGDIVRHPEDGVFLVQFYLDRFEAFRLRPDGTTDARMLYSVNNIVQVIGNACENRELLNPATA